MAWVAEDERDGRGEIRCRFMRCDGWGIGERVRSCWRTSKVFGQFPPRRVVSVVARSLESSWGKWGTLYKSVTGLFTVGRRSSREYGVEIARSHADYCWHVVRMWGGTGLIVFFYLSSYRTW